MTRKTVNAAERRAVKGSEMPIDEKRSVQSLEAPNVVWVAIETGVIGNVLQMPEIDGEPGAYRQVKII